MNRGNRGNGFVGPVGAVLHLMVALAEKPWTFCLKRGPGGMATYGSIRHWGVGTVDILPKITNWAILPKITNWAVVLILSVDGWT